MKLARYAAFFLLVSLAGTVSLIHVSQSLEYRFDDSVSCDATFTDF